MATQLQKHSVKDDFFKHLCADQTPKCLLANGNTIRAKFRHGKGSTFSVLFHPAVPPQANDRPYFLRFLPFQIPQISKSDQKIEGNWHSRFKRHV